LLGFLARGLGRVVAGLDIARADLDQPGPVAVHQRGQAELAGQQHRGALRVEQKHGGAGAVEIDLARQRLLGSIAAAVADRVFSERIPIVG
jgi:hypothetical protein